MKGENWLSPTNKIIWRKAFRSKAKEVTLGDGRKFTIEYLKNPDRAKVRPAKGFVPTGEFLMKDVTHDAWLTQTEQYGAGNDPRKPNEYEGMMRDFLSETHLKGVDVIEHWPSLQNKRVETLRQAFMRARTDVGQPARKVDIIRNEGKVYLVKS